MKRTIVLFVVVAFVVTLAGLAFGRTLVEERDAVRAYLSVVDAKIIKYRSQGNTAKVKLLQGEKAATLRRWEKVKAELEAAEAAPPPPPPMAPTPPPPPVAVRAAPAPSAGLFGWGLKTGATVGYVAGKSVITGRGDLIFADPMGIGAMLGLSEDAVNWKLGLIAATGKDINDVEKKAGAVCFDGVINIPADVMGGIESYVGGGVNYVIYGSKTKGDSRTGSYGVQAYYGIKGDIGLGGKSYAELGYSVLRTGKDVDLQYSMKGVSISVGTEITL
jgi:hypothetical protein